MGKKIKGFDIVPRKRCLQIFETEFFITGKEVTG